MKRASKLSDNYGNIAQPFLRWVGGKRLLVNKLLSFIPPSARNCLYYEPFVGAGSMYFALRPNKAVLSDLNQHLIECYRFIRDDYARVAAYLQEHAAANSKVHYYRVRDVYNRSRFSAAQAARFIYLNRTCYNGVFRVNRDGEFNVPFGDKPLPHFPSKQELSLVSRVLASTTLIVSDYEAVLDRAKRGHFIYLDPPYPPLNGTAYFTHYTSDRFSVASQERLAQVVASLDSMGCLIMMSNADIPLVRSLYRGSKFFQLSVTRYVTCKSIKHRVGELVITNYDLPGPKEDH